MNTNTMFRIGGCSGSFVAPSEDRLIFDEDRAEGFRRERFCRDRFGSRTSSYFLRHRDVFVIIDQGLGVEPVAEFVLDMLHAEGRKNQQIYCLQTHYHEDHISGIHTNSLLFQPDLELSFYSPQLACCTPAESEPMMQRILAGYFNEEKWPISLDQLDENGAERCHESFQLGSTLAFQDLRIQTLGLNHPGGCCGFRFEMPGSGPVVLMTDYETDEDPEPAIVEFMDGAALLLCDMQYRDEEYDGHDAIGRLATSRKGWGHGSPRSVLASIAATTRVPAQVRVIHHEPKRTDADLQRFCDETRDRMSEFGVSRSCEFDFGRDGDVFWFSS